MPRNIDNRLLHNAKNAKCDEFYTQLKDIERELVHYEKHFVGKTVLCNCDDPRFSNFFRYFVDNFSRLKIKKLIATFYQKNSDDLLCFSEKKTGYWYAYTGTEDAHPALQDMFPLKGNGDFRSAECVEFLKEADIVVTNPPFSLFREFVKKIMEYQKQFLIIGNINAITYKEIFSMIQQNLVWLGVNMGRGISGFIVPEDYELFGTEARIDEHGNRIVSTNNCLWLTNLDHASRHDFIPLKNKYIGNEASYKRYDNFDAINVDNTKDIPYDYFDVVGVPLTFLHKFNPGQFEIVKFRKGNDDKDLSIGGKCPYFRILIRRVTRSVI